MAIVNNKVGIPVTATPGQPNAESMKAVVEVEVGGGGIHEDGYPDDLPMTSESGQSYKQVYDECLVDKLPVPVLCTLIGLL